MMGTATSLHTDQTGRQVRKEHGNLVPSELFANHDMPSLIHTVNLVG